MPWLCIGKPKKKRRSSSSKVKDNAAVHRDNISGFVVIRQSQDALARDELPVTKGQVVELLYTNKEWNYVKDVDGQCGYVPRDYCLPLDRLEQIQSVRTAGTTIPRPPRPRSRPATLGLQQTSQEVVAEANVVVKGSLSSATSNVKQSARCRARPSENGAGSSTSGSRVVDSSTLDSTTTNNSTTCTQCCSAIFSFRGAQVVPVEVEGLPSSRSANTTTMPEVKKPHEGNRAVAGTNTHRALHRATSYQEAVITADQKLYGLTAGIRPTYLPLLPQSPQYNDEHEGDVGLPYHRHGTLEHNYETLDSMRSAATPITVDLITPRDVFQYEERKPHGIFVSETDYRPCLQGEVTLCKGEMVIVMDYGQGEWAWVMTASNQEGAVPKSILSRYLGDPVTLVGARSTREVPKVSVTTQTELVVSSAVMRETNSSNTNVGSVASPAPLTSKSHHNSMSMRRFSVATSPQVITTPSSVYGRRRHSEACACPPQIASGLSKEWFKSSDKVCEEEKAPSPQPEGCRTPPPQSGYLLPQPTTPSSLGNTSTLERCQDSRFVANSVDFEPEYDTISCISEQRKVKQTPVLIALKDCHPPATSKHTLVLKKGDILHHHPQEHYPNGWMWVYHTSHKRYGYVPKTHVAYMYVVQKKARRDQLSKEESV